MIERKLEGFVLNKTNYKENDAIFNILTRQGIQTFKARGILKITSKNASSCNYFMLSEYILTSKQENGNQLLKSSNIIKIYHKPFEDLLVSSCFILMLKIINQIAENIDVYDLSLKCFLDFENNIYPLNVLNYFLGEVIKRLGYQPNVNGCVNCQSKNNIMSFSLHEGGFICKNCFDGTKMMKYSANFLKTIRSFYENKEYEQINDTYSLTLFKLQIEFLKEESGIIINDLDFLYKCL